MKLLYLFLSFLIYTNYSFAQSKIDEKYPNINASQYYFLIDADNKEILAGKNFDERIAPSSMTKLMTAYVVFDQIKKGNIDLKNRCVIGKDAWRKSGSSMFLNYGDVVTIEDLVKGLLATSANDAAIALAETTGTNFENFIQLMNLKAQELNMKNSHFKNPHGLHEEGHYMSLRDLATLSIRIYNDFPEFADYLKIPEFTYRNITQKNRNPLIKNNYDGTLGGKTGHTNQGGYGLVAMVKRDNRRLVAVVNKVSSPKIREKMITELFDYGFEEFKKVYIFNKGDSLIKVPVWLGNYRKVEAVINEEVSFNIPRNKSINDIKITAKYKSPLIAPLKKNTKIAVLTINIKGMDQLKYDLYTKEKIDKVGFIRKIKRIIEYYINKILKFI
jgi:D-alanyl-D-alanine carboxypeptidase (penicillin-binding protein 5/6)